MQKICRICKQLFKRENNRKRLCSAECEKIYNHMTPSERWIARTPPKPVSREARMYSQMMARPDGFGPWHDPG